MLQTTSRRSAVLAVAAAVAGIALVATGCSSSSPAAAPVAHHPAKSKAAPASKATPVSPRRALANAVRTSLSAGTVMFRQRQTIQFVKGKAPFEGTNINPVFTVSGTANFDRDWAMYNYLPNGDFHAAQPSSPFFTVLQQGRKLFGGPTEALNNDGVWERRTASDDAAVDTLVDVLSNTTGKVTLVRKNARLSDGESGLTRYQVRIDVGRSLLDNGDPDSRAMGQRLVGQKATEDVWVDGLGRIVQVRTTFDTGQVQLPDVNPDVVSAEVFTTRLTNYGLDMVVPPHPTTQA